MSSPDVDPVDSDDLSVLKAEVLRARDEALGAATTAEVHANRIAELEVELNALGETIEQLSSEMRKPLVRVASAIQRRIPGRRS